MKLEFKVLILAILMALAVVIVLNGDPSIPQQPLSPSVPVPVMAKKPVPSPSPAHKIIPKKPLTSCS